MLNVRLHLGSHNTVIKSAVLTAHLGWCRRMLPVPADSVSPCLRLVTSDVFTAPSRGRRPSQSVENAGVTILGTPVLRYKVTVSSFINDFHLALHLFGA